MFMGIWWVRGPFLFADREERCQGSVELGVITALGHAGLGVECLVEVDELFDAGWP
jgi:hypothetical protein